MKGMEAKQLSKKYAKAIAVLAEEIQKERMQATIGGRGSLAESCANAAVESLQAAMDLLEGYENEEALQVNA